MGQIFGTAVIIIFPEPISLQGLGYRNEANFGDCSYYNIPETN